MIFYCPNCWSQVNQDEKICHLCRAHIEALDHQSYFEKLVNALNHSERTTRIRAAYILGELGDRRAIIPFKKIVSRTNGIQDVFFIEAISIAIGKLGGTEALPILIRLMKHPSFLVRKAVLNSLKKFKSKEALKVIRKALKDPSPNVQELAHRILGIC